MARKKISRKKTAARRKKPVSKRSPVRSKKTKRAAKPARKKAAAPRKKPAAKRAAPRKAKGRPTGRRGRPAGAAKRVRRDADLDVAEPLDGRGLGPESGGQSGDTEGLSRGELADSESVEELLEEGQAFEAGVISGVENAPDADRGPIRTRQVPEDDVPEEYIDRD